MTNVVTPPNKTSVMAALEPEPKRATPTRTFFARVLRSKVNVACLIVLGILIVVAVGAPWIAPYDPNAQNLMNAFAAPFSDGHVLGTDQLGRDILSRLIWASQVSLIAPVIAVSVASVIGIPLGLLAGYLGGRFDWIAGRIADAFIALPSLILALAIIAIFGPGLVNAMLAVGIAMSPALFRVVRGSTRRGGASALRQLLDQGELTHLAITPDGPRGPRRTLAQGAVYLASKLQMPLVALGMGFDRPWRVKSWDRFAIPRPGSRARAILSPEIHVPAGLD
ncbi:MAG: DUF374 domain-containing protein, partial [Microbacteriaceae bacterium]|nr:DUF374 domain-containing protein [Microbacteriaceae bacterium]